MRNFLLRRAWLALILAIVGISAVVGSRAGSADAAPATNLTAKIECHNNTDLSIAFSWKPSGDGRQWLDIGLAANFAPGTYAATGPMISTRDSLDWDTATRNATYYIRINTYDGSAWLPSEMLELETPACGAPEPEPEPVVEEEAPAPAPAPPAAMAGLRASLEQHIATAGFEAAVAVTDLQTGETISVNGDRAQFAGCTMNLFVLMQAAIDVQNGVYDESVVGSLISATIYGSNPVTARDILFIQGGGNPFPAMERVNGLLEDIGLSTTYYDHPPAYPHETLQGRSNLTTALEMNKALSALWNNQVMSVQWRDYLMAKMTEVKPGLNYLIPVGVSDGVTSHKNGFLALLGGWVDNDVGIVTFQSGGQTYAYAISFLTQSVPTKYGDIPLGQMVSSLVWQHFYSTY